MHSFEVVYLEADNKALEFLTSEHSFIIQDRKVYVPKPETHEISAYTRYAELSTGRAPQRYVMLSIAPLRLELDLDVGYTDGMNSEEYSIQELYRLENGGEFPKRTHNLYEAMHDGQLLRHEFERLSSVFKECGRRFFANDKTLWDDLKSQRTSTLKAEETERAHLNAERAFQEKNWQKIIEILQPIENTLGEVDLKRLKYARNKTT